MRAQQADERRIDYLMKVLERFMDSTLAGEEVMEWDDSYCDGFCLYEDIKSCLEDEGVI